MASLYVTLDKRSPKKDGSCPLKLALTLKRTTAYASLDTSIMPDEWDAENSQVVGRTDKKFLNVLLRKRLDDADTALARIARRNDFDDFTTAQILNMVMRGSDTADTAETADYVLPVYNEYITLCRKANTAALFRASLKNLITYEPDIDSLRFKAINVAWLRRYQAWLTDRQNGNGMEVNGANVYLRNLRTVFNYALKNEYTRARYPFRDIDMTTTAPDKRSVEYEKFLAFASYPLAKDDFREIYRDLFMLSFYLCGIRPVDLLVAKKSDVKEGRLVYRPMKLNDRTELSIKIEPEAWEIIRKYEGKEHLINVMDERTDYKAFCKHWNIGLRCVGVYQVSPRKGRNGKTYNFGKYYGIIRYLSSYYARTCWATYAYNVLDIPMDTISQALGHKNGLKVTNFYVKRDNARVDKANRDLIDRVTKDIAEYKAQHPQEPAEKR